MSNLLLTFDLITFCLFCNDVLEAPTVMMHAFCHRTLVGLVSQYDVKYCTGSLTMPALLLHVSPPFEIRPL